MNGVTIGALLLALLLPAGFAPAQQSQKKTASSTVQTAPPAPAVQNKINPVDGLPYVWIPPGNFRMGCSDGDSECSPDQSPAHPVTLTKEFWMGRTEVTAAAYRKFAQATGRSGPSSAGDNHPVVNMDWNDASAYCKWAGGRLPSEAEWEYAARAGTGGARYGELDRIAWYLENSGGHTNPVGKKAPNRFGLYDMLGNVWEWCADWYADSYSGSGGQTDPAGPSSGIDRVVRGGSWVVIPRDPRASHRVGLGPRYRSAHSGFRCVREAIP
jgi:formylglycine-generating enzyme required for sulfatase activity